MISCEEALRQIQEYLDGALEGVSAEEVRRHFEVCQVCYPHLALEESFRAALRRTMEGERTPPEVRDELLRALEAEARREED